MSTIAFAALATRREQSDSGTSTSAQSPGINPYVDVLAALVPAEVLGIHALIVAATASQSHDGQVLFTEPNTLRWAFWLLVGLAAALFVLGRRPVPAPAETRGQAGGAAPRWQNWEWQDLIRIVIPPAAFVCWTMAEPSGVWSAVSPGMSSSMRLLIPMVGAVLLAAVTKALASHADKKPSPAQRRQTAPPPAARPTPTGKPAPPDQPTPANQLPLTEQPALTEYGTASPALPVSSTAIESIPKWVY